MAEKYPELRDAYIAKRDQMVERSTLLVCKFNLKNKKMSWFFFSVTINLTESQIMP